MAGMSQPVQWGDEPQPSLGELRRRAAGPESVSTPVSARSASESDQSRMRPVAPVRALPEGEAQAVAAAPGGAENVSAAEPGGGVYAAAELFAAAQARQVTRRATRGVRAALRMKASKAEVAEVEANEAMATSFGQPVNVVVANPKGSAGKTPISLALAAAFGSARGGGVLALEVHELRGTMALRTVGRAGTVRDFLDNLHRFRPDTLTRGDVEAFTRKQPAGLFEAMVSARAHTQQLTAQEFELLQSILRRFFSVIVIDTANNEAAPAWKAAVQTASALVVPVKWRTDVWVPAVEMLEDLQRTAPHLARRAIVVASHGAGEASEKSRAEARAYFQQRAAHVVELPTDPHVSDGGPIVWDQLSESYRVAARSLGQAVARSIPQHDFSPPPSTSQLG